MSESIVATLASTELCTDHPSTLRQHSTWVELPAEDPAFGSTRRRREPEVDVAGAVLQVHL